MEKIYNYIYLDLFNNYCIHACRLPAVYENFRGFWWWFIEIFWIFAQRASKVDFWTKKSSVFLQWWFNQEWPIIGADTVYWNNKIGNSLIIALGSILIKGYKDTK